MSLMSLSHLLQLFRNNTHFQGRKGWKGEVGEQGTSVRTILARHNDHSLCYFFHLATFASTCIPLKSAQSDCRIAHIYGGWLYYNYNYVLYTHRFPG